MQMMENDSRITASKLEAVESSPSSERDRVNQLMEQLEQSKVYVKYVFIKKRLFSQNCLFD